MLVWLETTLGDAQCSYISGNVILEIHKLEQLAVNNANISGVYVLRSQKTQAAFSNGRSQYKHPELANADLRLNSDRHIYGREFMSQVIYKTSGGS
jgi:hypothetical protein